MVTQLVQFCSLIVAKVLIRQVFVLTHAHFTDFPFDSFINKEVFLSMVTLGDDVPFRWGLLLCLVHQVKAVYGDK